MLKRLRSPLLILGIVLSAVVCGAVVLVLRFSQPQTVELPVAIDDIEPGTAINPKLFRLEEVSGLSSESLDAYVTKEEFLGDYNGLPALETIYAGSPILKAQMPDPDDPDVGIWRQKRLTLLLKDPENVVYPIPVSADQVGNYIYTGDYVDVVFTLGRVAMSEFEHSEKVEVPDLPMPGATLPTTPTVPTAPPVTTIKADEWVTTTLSMPVAKVILPNVHVLKVEREVQRSSASASVGTGDDSEPVVIEGDVVRLYVELSRADAEVLSFVLHNGALNLPARAEPSDTTTEGYFWEDFVDALFADRDMEELEALDKDE
jgi:Flp pilus assembly protein CpaB